MEIATITTYQVADLRLEPGSLNHSSNQIAWNVNQKSILLCEFSSQLNGPYLTDG